MFPNGTGNWKRLPREVVDSPSLQISRPAWTPTCATCCRGPALAEGLDKTVSRSPFQPLQLCDSVITEEDDRV